VQLRLSVHVTGMAHCTTHTHTHTHCLSLSADRLHTLQWWARGGLYAWHLVQKRGLRETFLTSVSVPSAASGAHPGGTVPGSVTAAK
jgi:hypothetical protein